MRQCVNPECRQPITKCDGFVVARDYLDYLAAPGGKIRELCGKCVFKFEGSNQLFEQLLERTS